MIAEWVIPDALEPSAAMDLFWRTLDQDLPVYAPPLLFLEVGNALLTGIRRHRWSGVAAELGFAKLRDLPLRVIDDARDIDRAWALSRQFTHPIYDMVYVALAERLNTQLFTSDRPLLRRLTTLPWVRGLDG